MNQETIDKQEGQEIAEEILRQLKSFKTNGFPLLNYYGCDQFHYDKDGTLQFRVKMKGRNINRVLIKVNGLDLYNIEFWYCRVLNKDPYVINNKVKEFTDIYNDQVGSIINSVMEGKEQ